MKRRLNVLLFISLALMVLAGCITQQTETAINPDGSGVNVFRVGMTKQALQQMKAMDDGSGQMDDPFADARSATDAMPKEWNATAKDWSDDKFEGVEMRLEFKDVAMLNTQLNEIFGGSGSNPGDNTFSDVSVTDDGSNVTVNAKVFIDASELEAQGGAEMFKDAKVFWAITMPGEIKEISPEGKATIDGTTATWNVSMVESQDYTIKIVSDKSGPSGGSMGGGLSLPLILGIVGALLVVGGGAFWFMRRNKVAVPAAAGYGQQPYDPNAYGQQPYQQPTDPNAGYGQQYQQPTDPNAGYGQQYQQPTDPNAGYGQQYQQPTDPNAGYGQQYQQPGSSDQQGGTPPHDPNKTTRF